MALTYPTFPSGGFYGSTDGIIRVHNSRDMKRAIVYAQFDASYPTGGELLNLQAAPFLDDAYFSNVLGVNVLSVLTTAQNAFPARSLCCAVRYLPVLNGAGNEWDPAAGFLVAYRENAYCCEVQVANTIDLSSVLVALEVIGG